MASSRRLIVVPIILVAALCLAGSATAADPPDTRLVQVSMLIASKDGPISLDDLPENTRQAVEDIREFLPYSSYRIIDTSLVRSARHSRTSMNGLDGEVYDVSLVLDRGASDGEVYVREFSVMARPTLETVPGPRPDDEREDATPVLAPRIRSVISTSFTAKVGETVVVGSSRLNGGDQALILLFTALPG